MRRGQRRHLGRRQRLDLRRLQGEDLSQLERRHRITGERDQTGQHQTGRQRVGAQAPNIVCCNRGNLAGYEIDQLCRGQHLVLLWPQRLNLRCAERSDLNCRQTSGSRIGQTTDQREPTNITTNCSDLRSAEGRSLISSECVELPGCQSVKLGREESPELARRQCLGLVRSHCSHRVGSQSNDCCIWDGPNVAGSDRNNARGLNCSDLGSGEPLKLS